MPRHERPIGNRGSAQVFCGPDQRTPPTPYWVQTQCGISLLDGRPVVEKGATLTLETSRRNRPVTITENEWQRVAEAQFFQAIEGALLGVGEPAVVIDSHVDPRGEYKINGSGATLDRYIIRS